MLALASSKEEVMEKIKKDIYADKGVWDMDKVSARCFVRVWRRGRNEVADGFGGRFRFSRSRVLLDLRCR